MALEVRAEVGLGTFEPIDPRLLADLYGIPVMPLSGIAGCPPVSASHIAELGNATFSAALVPYGTGMFIVENDSQTDTRRRASLAHEMAHIFWEHQFTTVLFNTDGCRSADPEKEEEADRLGGEILIPSEAAISAARQSLSDEEVAAAYAVSVPYARMRMNLSGARTVVKRQRAYRARL